MDPLPSLFERLRNVRHVHISPRHRGRRAFPPLRFVCPQSSGRAVERGGDRSWFGCILWGPADGVGRSRLGAARPQVPFFMDRSRLVCRHLARPRAGASKPDRSDGPHLIDGRQSDSQARACIVRRVHPSLCHRRRRTFPPRRFVAARSAPVHEWRAVGRGGLPKLFVWDKFLKRRVQLTFVMVA